MGSIGLLEGICRVAQAQRIYRFPAAVLLVAPIALCRGLQSFVGLEGFRSRV